MLEKISRDIIVATIMAAYGPDLDQKPDIVLVRALARCCAIDGKDIEEVVVHLREAFKGYTQDLPE